MKEKQGLFSFFFTRDGLGKKTSKNLRYLEYSKGHGKYKNITTFVSFFYYVGHKFNFDLNTVNFLFKIESGNFLFQTFS